MSLIDYPKSIGLCSSQLPCFSKAKIDQIPCHSTNKLSICLRIDGHQQCAERISYMRTDVITLILNEHI